MVDKVKPIKIEQGQDIDYTEVDSTQDYLAAKGIAVENSDNHLIHSADNEIAFTDPVSGTKKVSDLLVDEKSKVSANDTTGGYLNGKLVAGTNISLTENNDGGNETLTIAVSGSASDEKTKVSSNDTTADYLENKLSNNGNVTFTTENDGSNETVKADASLAISDLSDIPTKPTTGEYILEASSGTVSWLNFAGIKSQMLFWEESPSFNGGMNLLGAHSVVSTAASLASGSPITTPVAFYKKFVVLNVSSVSGPPFTVRITGSVADDSAGTYSTENDDITVTGSGYYKSSMPFVNAPTISIVESGKSCTVDIYSVCYFFIEGATFTITGACLEWTPEQNNWDVDIDILHLTASGDTVIIDTIEFHDSDTVERAAANITGTYMRQDLNTVIDSTIGLEGLIVTVNNQQGLEHFMLGVRFDAA